MIFALALFLACTPTALLDFAVAKWKADKNVRVEDAYKWLFQATRGGEHVTPGREMAKQWLDGEWSSLGDAAKGEPLWEPLCPSEEIGRVNLRAFKKVGGKEDDILEAFLNSSREYKAPVEAFTAAWFELRKRLKKHPFGKVTLPEWTRLDAQMKTKNYPAVHHSEIYTKANQPAYRIVTNAEMLKLKTGLTKNPN